MKQPRISRMTLMTRRMTQGGRAHGTLTPLDQRHRDPAAGPEGSRKCSAAATMNRNLDGVSGPSSQRIPGEIRRLDLAVDQHPQDPAHRCWRPRPPRVGVLLPARTPPMMMIGPPRPASALEGWRDRRLSTARPLLPAVPPLGEDGHRDHHPEDAHQVAGEEPSPGTAGRPRCR